MFTTVRYINTIWSALCSADLGECFTYSECMYGTHEKFSTGVWSQSLCQKPTHFVSEALPKSRIFCHFCVGFWRRLWLQKSVDKFLCVVSIRCEHVKHSPRLEKSSAHWIRTVRLTKHFLLKEKWLLSGFLKCKSLKFCHAPEYSIILCEFLAKNLTSEPRRKFSMCRTHTFGVCKTFYWITEM